MRWHYPHTDHPGIQSGQPRSQDQTRQGAAGAQRAKNHGRFRPSSGYFWNRLSWCLFLGIPVIIDKIFYQDSLFRQIALAPLIIYNSGSFNTRFSSAEVMTLLCEELVVLGLKFQDDSLKQAAPKADARSRIQAGRWSTIETSQPWWASTPSINSSKLDHTWRPVNLQDLIKLFGPQHGWKGQTSGLPTFNWELTESTNCILMFEIWDFVPLLNLLMQLV